MSFPTLYNPPAPPRANIRSRRRPRPRFSLRPFLTATGSIILLYTLTYFTQKFTRLSPLESPEIYTQRRSHKPSAPPISCRDVISAPDKCAFIQEYCIEENSGLIPYLTLYYCTSPFPDFVSLFVLVSWLGLLFTTIGIAASDFFSVNLATISGLLGLSQSLAGVTFLAFGNGSPDLFSTFAAMGSGSASMAVGELIGAASFITAVVAGSMALVKEFRVARQAFVRDICFFIFAIIFTVYFLFDGKLLYWECWAMIAYYGLYVCTVVGCHWYDKRRAAQKAILDQHLNSTAPGAFEPYRDNPISGTSSARIPGSPSTCPSTPRSRLDPSHPGIESGISRCTTGEDLSDAGSDYDGLVAAEISNNMRIRRGPGRRRGHTAVGAIRPSLVGALEFRSDLDRIKKEADPLAHLNLPVVIHRRPHGHQRCWSATDLNGVFAQTQTSPSRSLSPSIGGSPLLSPMQIPRGHARTLSSGDKPMGLAQQLIAESGEGPSRSESTASLHSFTVDGSLAPPPINGVVAEPTKNLKAQALTPPKLPKLQIPVPLIPKSNSTSRSESPISPFPGFSLSSQPLSPQAFEPPYTIPEASESDVDLPLLSRTDYATIPIVQVDSPEDSLPAGFSKNIDEDDETRWKWWPEMFPSPHALSCTLFPTLQNWGDKGYWDRFAAILTAPSVLLLVLTLPVAEGESKDCQSDDSIYSYAIATPVPSALPSPDTPIPSIPGSPVTPTVENEWQRYRRLSKSIPRKTKSQSPTHPHSPILIAVESADGECQVPSEQDTVVVGNVGVDPALLTAKVCEVQEADDFGWSRWLVGVQIFTGPAFFMCVLWLNTLDELDDPTFRLEQLLAGGLVISTIIFIPFILTTTHDTRPRSHSLVCFLGFLVSIAWISTIANEVVGVLKAIGVILSISEALLGLTVFAAGNSLGDLVADITVARLGYPVMALAACFGGPMLNILLGIGVGGVMMMVRKARHRLKHHPGETLKYKPFKVEVGGALLVSAVGLLVLLGGLLIVVPRNNWVMSRKIGWGLILFWALVTGVNVGLTVGGYLS